jgi:predicted metal-dependent phosphoesterase TrpH
MTEQATQRSRVELHCHTSFSFDGDVEPPKALDLACAHGLTHLAITDHDTLEGAMRVREVAPCGLTVIVGQEARTTEGDMIALFVERAIPSGLTPEQTAEAIRAQEGLVGLPHPFDVYRPSIGRGAVKVEQLSRLAALVDYVEVHNGRVADARANELAADFARDFGLPAVAVSDAHTEAEFGTCATVLRGPITGPADLLSTMRAGTTLSVQEPEPHASLVDRLRNRFGGDQR